MNNLYKMLGNNMPPIVQKYLQFMSTFNGTPRDAQAQVQQLLNSGMVSQEKYNQAVQMAQQLQMMLPPSAHRR